MSASIDLAVGPNPNHPARLMLHRIDCPLVRQQAADGEPVMTMIGCASMPPNSPNMPYHDCLKEGV